jgi:hypothetical protein
MFKHSSRFAPFLLFLACGLACVFLFGCARLGERANVGALPEGAPDGATILADLAKNDAAIGNFKAKGSMTLASPDFTGVKTCDDGLVSFRRPSDLCVIGKKLVVGVTVFRITCVGEEFLIEFPATPEDEPYYSVHGEKYGNFHVAPSDIAREMFLPEDWATMKPKDFHIASYDSASGTATVEIGSRRFPHRRIVVAGPPWRVTRSERLDKDGGAAAITTMDDYREIDGVRFPAKVDASFPSEQTRMTMDIRKIWTNTKLDDALFNVEARAREAGVDLNKTGTEQRRGKEAR